MKSLIYLIEADPALTVVRDYVAARQHVRDEAVAIAKEYGAPRFVTDPFTYALTGLQFDRGLVHRQFKAPNRYGTSYPKLKTEARKRFKALKGVEPGEGIIAEHFGVPLSLEYKDGYGHGWTRTGEGLKPCGFLFFGKDGPFAMWVPDVAAQIAELIAQGYTVTTLAPPREFPGCRQILQEEWELMVAQDNLEKARHAT